MTSDWVDEGMFFLDKGGVVIWILCALSIVAAAIILLKIWQFWRLRPGQTGFIEITLSDLSGQNDQNDQGGQNGKNVQNSKNGQQAALERLSRINHPVARVMESTITSALNPALSPRDRDAEIERVGSRAIRQIESQLGALEIIANLSPLLGLLGTVIGMIAAFSELEQAGTNVDPTVLAGGIWTALLTTAYGLAVAIPALGAFHLFENTINTIRDTMKDAAVAVGNTLKADGLADDRPDHP